MKNKSITNRWVYLQVIFFFFLIAPCLPHQAQEHEKIIEKVEVENVEILVRVFTNTFQKLAKKTNLSLNPDVSANPDAESLTGWGRRPLFEKGHPVGGLKKEDFQLFVNGKPKPVDGFFETRKKLEETPASPDSPTETVSNQPPRLFVLIFNLSSINQDLDSHLNTLFQRIIRPNDRLMVITNHYFISEWKVDNCENDKNKIKGVLEKETKKLRFEILRIENGLIIVSRPDLTCKNSRVPLNMPK